MDASPSNAFPGEPVDLARLVRNTVQGRHFHRPHYCVMVQVPETPVWVLADLPNLERIINVLLNLACRQALAQPVVELLLDLDPGTSTVRLHLRPLDGELVATELKALETLCAPFGGSFESDSEGTALRLPVQQESAPVEADVSAPTAGGEHHRILVIEDNRDGSATLRRLLELAGHEVEVAYTGLEGLRLAESWRPDYVLCDIGLPELDGYHVADELRRKPRTAAAHLIAITGYGSPEDRERSRRHGFERHFTKPVDPMMLLSLLANSA